MKHATGHPLQRWAEATGQTYDDIARSLQVTRGRISQIILGYWPPSDELAARISSLTHGAVTPAAMGEWQLARNPGGGVERAAKRLLAA